MATMDTNLPNNEMKLGNDIW
jgi:hypothetical protein